MRSSHQNTIHYNDTARVGDIILLTPSLGGFRFQDDDGCGIIIDFPLAMNLSSVNSDGVFCYFATEGYYYNHSTKEVVLQGLILNCLPTSILEAEHFFSFV